MLAPPRRFTDPDLEVQFLKEYRSIGRVTASYGFALGAFMSILGYALFETGISGYPSAQMPQTVRLMNLFVFFSLIAILIKAPAFSTKHYKLLVGFGAFFAMYSIGAMTLSNAISNPSNPGKLLIATIIGSLIVYSFMRLPIGVATTACLSAAVPAYAACLISEPEHRFGVLMYLIVANIVGWISCIQIERRERRVFSQTQELRALGSQLELRIEQISQATIATARMIHGVAHDLRQPLVSLDLYFAQLKAELATNGKLTNEVSYERIRSCITLMHIGIADLVKQTNRENSKIEVEGVDIAELLEEVLGVLDVQGKAKNVTIKYRRPRSKQAFALTNSDAVRGVFLNVVGNAIKFHDSRRTSGSLVLVSIATIPGSFRVDIWDNGVGISPTDLGKVFDPYWRAENLSLINVSGLGLGMHIVRQLCDRLPLHHVAIKSVLGVGTRVRIRIPRVR